MKLNSLKLVLLTIAALNFAACGGSNNENQPSNVGGTVMNTQSAYGAYGIPNPGAGVLPVPGQYYNPYGGYSACPIGYQYGSSACNVMQASQFTCPMGSVWNGWACAPSGFSGCSTGLTWSWQYYGCLGTQATVSGYACYPLANGSYACYYNQSAPASNMMWYGYGWIYQNYWNQYMYSYWNNVSYQQWANWYYSWYYSSYSRNNSFYMNIRF